MSRDRSQRPSRDRNPIAALRLASLRGAALALSCAIQEGTRHTTDEQSKNAKHGPRSPGAPVVKARADTEGAPVEAMSCVVALVGFPYPLRSIGRGVLERCGLVVVQFPTPQVALRTLRTRVRVDAVIIDAHHQWSGGQSAAVEALLMFAEAAPWDGVPLPVIVLPGGDMPSGIRDTAAARGVHFVPPRQNYRAVARLARQLCGLDGTCCNGSA